MPCISMVCKPKHGKSSKNENIIFLLRRKYIFFQILFLLDFPCLGLHTIGIHGIALVLTCDPD